MLRWSAVQPLVKWIRDEPKRTDLAELCFSLERHFDMLERITKGGAASTLYGADAAAGVIERSAAARHNASYASTPTSATRLVSTTSSDQADATRLVLEFRSERRDGHRRAVEEAVVGLEEERPVNVGQVIRIG